MTFQVSIRAFSDPNLGDVDPECMVALTLRNSGLSFTALVYKTRGRCQNDGIYRLIMCQVTWGVKHKTVSSV